MNQESNKIEITSGSDRGCYINSTSLVTSIDMGSGGNGDGDGDTSSTIGEESDSQLTPTQEINFDEDVYVNTQSSTEAEEDETTRFKTSNENKSNFKHLVRLKSTLRNYEIPYSELVVERELGKGFFGQVYKARWRDRSVALKKITITRFRDRTESDIFEKELNIISKLCHPTCVMFIGACSTDPNNRCIVMEYMAGGSLRKLLDERSSWLMSNPFLQFSIARDIASGMNYLHTNFEDPIIHRDLTSSNVLLDGNFSAAKINDFGLSKEMKPGPNEMTAAMGSLAWMAPESFKGEKYTEKVDIYSYAIILWELLTCKDPYCGMEPLKMAFLAAMEDYRPPLGDIPPYWQDLMKKCWNPKPSQRPTFSEILGLLDQIEKELNVYNNNNNKSSPSMLSSQRSSLATPNSPIGYYESNSDKSTSYNMSVENQVVLPQPSRYENSNAGNSGAKSQELQIIAQNFQPNEIPDQIKLIPHKSTFLVSFRNEKGEGLFLNYYHQFSNQLIKQYLIPSTVLSMSYQVVSDYTYLAVSTIDNRLSIYDLGNPEQSNQPVKSFYIDKSSTTSGLINDIAWSGTNVVTGLSDSTLKIWDIERGAPISEFIGHNGPVLSVDSHSSQQLIVSGGSDCKIKLWDSRNAHCFRFFQSDSPVSSLSLRSQLRDPILLSGSSQGYFNVWNMYTSSCLNTFQTHSKEILGIHSNLSVNQILSYSADGNMSIFSTEQSNPSNGTDVTDENINFSKNLNVNNFINNSPIRSAQLIGKNRILFSASNKLYSILI